MVDKNQEQLHRSDSDKSQNTCNEDILEEDQKTLQVERIDLYPEENHYPAVLECAPFPVLGSLDEISQTLSRVKSNQTQKGFNINEKTDEYIKEEIIKGTTFKQEAYYTDGFRNPGWLTVISCFLVNFFVFGSCFSWGVYQKLYVHYV